MFPLEDIIHWIVSHTDPEMMTFSSVNGTKFETFRAEDYDEMYQISEPMTIMETPFSLPINNANSKDILKSWVKESARFRMTQPNLQDEDLAENISILGHIHMSTVWPRMHRNLSIELGDHARPTNQRGKTMQLV